MDFVLTVPLTDLSAAIVIVPVPDADVITGGVSCAPVKLIFTSTAKADPLPTMNTAEAISPRMLVRLMKRFISRLHRHVVRFRSLILVRPPIGTPSACAYIMRSAAPTRALVLRRLLV